MLDLMWRAPLLWSVLALGCEFDAFRSDELCSDETPCLTGVCVQGLCQPRPEMALLDAGMDAGPDAAAILDARPIDAQAQPDARPTIDMAAVVDARPPMPDQAIVDAFVPVPDMAAPEPDPEPFGFTGVECGGPEHLCVLVGADATISKHAPDLQRGEVPGPSLVLEGDADNDDRLSDVLVGFALRPALLADADGLELLLPREGRADRYRLPINAIYVSSAWDEATVTWNTLQARGELVMVDADDEDEFIVLPLDALLDEAQDGNGRFSVELRLRDTDETHRFYARETPDRPAARLRFRFDPE